MNFSVCLNVTSTILLLFLSGAWAHAATPGSIAIWANNGEDKIAQEERRLLDAQGNVRNSVWDGESVSIVAARNETVAFNLVLEASEAGLKNVRVRLKSLQSDEGEIRSREMDPDNLGEELFDLRGRNIELFFVRYLKIKGCSILAYEHYDERHVPARLRRPHNHNGVAKGGWEERPDHDRSYPDIAVPIELHPAFDVAAKQSQSIWCDVYVPSETKPGEYRGNIEVEANGMPAQSIPVHLAVLDLSLPELPSAKTMLFVSQEDINERYIGQPYVDGASLEAIKRSRKVIDRHFQLAHRHRISLIHEHTPIEQMDAIWKARLDGSLFTLSAGYDGPGKNVGNNVHSIGTYGGWPWKEAPNPKDAMERNTDAWVRYFEKQNFSTPTQPFLYLADESDDYTQLEEWASWVKGNPGPGSALPTLVTLPLPKSKELLPSVTLPCSTVAMGITKQWAAAAQYYRETPEKSFFLYNGGRPGSGTMVTDDDGVAMRQLAWCQFKFRVPRWFIWSGTYYKNYQGTGEHTKLFSQAHTFGGKTGVDKSLGETGWNYNNGDGVLFYPGTDKVHADESYSINGPIASLRMKHWRRGLQDYEYLKWAFEANPDATTKVVQKMIPRVLWEVGVDDLSDPTYARTDISWSTDPDDWEAARVELVKIIMEKR